MPLQIVKKKRNKIKESVQDEVELLTSLRAATKRDMEGRQTPFEERISKSLLDYRTAQIKRLNGFFAKGSSSTVECFSLSGKDTSQTEVAGLIAKIDKANIAPTDPNACFVRVLREKLEEVYKNRTGSIEIPISAKEKQVLKGVFPREMQLQEVKDEIATSKRISRKERNLLKELSDKPHAQEEKAPYLGEKTKQTSADFNALKGRLKNLKRLLHEEQSPKQGPKAESPTSPKGP